MTKIVEVIVSSSGQVRIQTKGFNGSDCRDASRGLELALGQPQGEQLTAEFHQSLSSQESNRQKA